MLPSAVPELPLLGRVSNAKKEELLQTNQMLRTMGLIQRAEELSPSQNPDDIAGLEWHLQCAAAANAPSGGEPMLLVTCHSCCCWVTGKLQWQL
jgi:hypothetical protein